MNRSRHTRRRGAAALVVMAATMFALLPAAPASGSEFTIVVRGIAELSAGIGACNSTGRFVGHANGFHGTVPVVNAVVTATFVYCDPDTLTGVADGEVTIAGGSSVAGSWHKTTCDFTWERIGVVADVELANCTSGGIAHTPSSGTAVAEFVPTSVPGAVPAFAQVVAEGIFSASQTPPAP